jgi:threonine/homoserine/homoserine lactone efflux protein
MGRTIGTILMIIGVVLLIWTGFTYTKKEKIIDAGPIQVSADREKSVNWPPYAGAIVLVVGAVLFISNKKGN